jgi:hypothetical protein
VSPPVPLSRSTRSLWIPWLLTPAICQFNPTVPMKAEPVIWLFLMS